jgi:hypothetical protein
MKRLERELLLADRSVVVELLDQIDADDPAGRYSLAVALKRSTRSSSNLANVAIPLVE